MKLLYEHVAHLEDLYQLIQVFRWTGGVTADSSTSLDEQRASQSEYSITTISAFSFVSAKTK